MALTRILVFPVPYDNVKDAIQGARRALDKATVAQTVFAGLQIENPNMLQLMIGKFAMAYVVTGKILIVSEDNDPIGNMADTLSDCFPDSTVLSVMFEQAAELSDALAAPVTEMVTFYFGREAPSDYDDTIARFREIIRSVDGVISSANGWVKETCEYQGVQGKGAVLAIGWSSVDAHMHFRKTQLFRDNIHLARNKAEKVEMHHVAFQKV
jgi:hypothetical protein